MSQEHIETVMAGEIARQHAETQTLIDAANKAVKQATEAAAYTGALIDKLQPHMKSTLYQWVSEHSGIDGVTARSYTLAHSTAAKRMAHADRRCLQRLGILESQVSTAPAKVKRQPVSLQAKCNRARNNILTHVSKRPVSSMSRSERIMLASNLEPLARLYMEATQAAE